MSKKRICLDAGHSGSKYNAGVVNGYYESAIVWKLTMLEKEFLEKMGVEVVLTRTSISGNPSLVNRGKKAKGCDLFVSNHTNACGDSSIRRASVIHLTNKSGTPADERSKDFAEQLAMIIDKTMGNIGHKIYSKKANSDRDHNGVKDDNYYGVLHGSALVDVPGVIVEHSFHTNAKTCKWLMDDDNLRTLAEECAKCMASFVGATNPDKNTTTEEDDIDMRTIKQGSTGKAVEIWQVIIGKTVDGKFGKDTKAGTIELQKKAFPNDPDEWDGIVGPKTWKAGFATIK